MPPLRSLPGAAIHLLWLASLPAAVRPLSAPSRSGGAWTQQSRLQFLSSAFFASTVVVATSATTESCSAAAMDKGTDKKDPPPPPNPRFYDGEVEMKYADNSDGSPRIRKQLMRRFTGDSTPFEFPVTPLRLERKWPKDEPPFTPEDFFRADQQDDGSFYAVPRFVYHIDEPAVASLTQYYRRNIPPNSDVLDICSSWVSHYPLEFPETMNRISGTGMSQLELDANDQFTGDRIARDLNVDPTLPFDDGAFDAVTCVVSIDYLIHPIEVLREVRRVLRPGGKVIISQSNRCFPSKAIAMWLKMNDREHLELIDAYFQYAGGFKPRKAYDITAKCPDRSSNDPMYIVEAVKKT